MCSAKRGMIRALSTSSLQRSERIFRNRPFRSAGGLFFCPSRPVDIPSFGDNFFHNVEISVDNSPLSPCFVNFRAAPFSLPSHTQHFYPHSPPIFPHHSTLPIHTHSTFLSPRKTRPDPSFPPVLCPSNPIFLTSTLFSTIQQPLLLLLLLISIIYKKYLLRAKSLSPPKAQTLQNPLIRANPPYFLPANRLS